MIIKAPTGLWKNKLPVLPEDNRSVTFTISNQSPPPIRDLFVPKLPDSVITRPLPIPENKILDDSDRRRLFGQRIKSIVSGAQIHIRDGKKLFEAGEAIEFSEDTTSLQNRLSVEEISITHNTNIIDLTGAGLTEEEARQIESDAELAREEIRNQIAYKQSEIDIQTSNLGSIQRKINESSKILKSLTVIYNLDGSYPSGNDKYDKIYDNLQQTNNEKESVIKLINSLNSEVVSLKDRLIRLSEVIR